MNAQAPIHDGLFQVRIDVPGAMLAPLGQLAEDLLLNTGGYSSRLMARRARSMDKLCLSPDSWEVACLPSNG